MMIYVFMGIMSYSTQAVEVWVAAFFIINIVGYYYIYKDKQLAIHSGAYRIPETTFFLLSILGGSIGTLLGILLVRHKTKHLSFKLGIPAIIIIQILLVSYLLSVK